MKTGRTQDLINAMAGTSNTLAGLYEQKLAQDSALTLRRIQRQFAQDSTIELDRIQETEDIERWPEMMNDFLTRTSDSFSKKTKADGSINPYYCKNSYEAKKATEMLNAQYVQLQQTMVQRSLERMDKNFVANTMDELNAILNDPTLSTNGKVGNLMATLNTIKMYMDPSQYSQLQKQYWYQAVDSEYKTLYQTAIEDGLDKGQTWNDVKKRVDAAFKYEDFVIPGEDGKNLSKAAHAEYKSNFKNTEKEMKSLYDANLKDLQETNRTKCVNYVRDIENSLVDKNYAQANSLISQGFNYLQSIKNTQKMSNDQQEHYSDKFLALKKQLEAEIAGDEKAAREAQVSSAKSDIQNEASNLLEEVKSGTMPADVAKEALYEYTMEMYPEQFDELTDTYSSIFDKLYRESLDFIWKDARFNDAKIAYDTIVAEAKKNPDLYNLNYITSALLDLTAGVELQNLDPTAFNKQMEKIKNNVFLESYNRQAQKNLNVTMDEEGNVTDVSFNDNLSASKKDDYFKQMAAAAEESDPVYSDDNGILHFSSPEAEQAVKGNAQLFKQLVIDSIGPENIPGNASIKVNLYRDESGDETAIPVVEIPHFEKVIMNGKEVTTQNVVTDTYKLEAAKNKKGKVIGYKIVDQNGKELPAADYKAMEKAKKQQIKDLKKQDKQAKKQSNQNKLDARENTYQLDESLSSADLKKTIEQTNKPNERLSKALDITEHSNEWSKASTNAKKEWLIEIKEEIEQGTDKGRQLMEALNIDAEDLKYNDWWKVIISA